MSKNFYCLGMMSGTSMDGIDGSIIYSNGIDNFEVIENFYCKYDNIFNNKLSDIRNKIVNLKDLKYHENELNKLEREITILHAEFANKILKNSNNQIDCKYSNKSIYKILHKQSLEKLLFCEMKATVKTLHSNKKPMRVIILDSLKEENIGFLMMFFIIETILGCFLMNVNPSSCFIFIF